jgi:hypothetical protein
MHTQENKMEAGKRKSYQAPVVEKIQIDTEFTFFTTSTGGTGNTPPGENSIVFNPFKFFK